MTQEKARPIPPGSEHRPEQRHSAPGAKRTQGLLHCVCAEHAQPGNPRGPSPAHATCRRRHCLRALLSDRGIYAVAIERVVRSGKSSGRHAHASGPGVADAARAQRLADPRHLIDRTPSTKSGSGQTGSRRPMQWQGSAGWVRWRRQPPTQPWPHPAPARPPVRSFPSPYRCRPLQPQWLKKPWMV